MRVSSYRVLTASRLYELEQQVRGFIDTGWEPQGGINREDGKYYQAMVKYTEIQVQDSVKVT